MNSLMHWRPAGDLTPMTLAPGSSIHILGAPTGSTVYGSVNGVLSGVAGPRIQATYAPPMGGYSGYYSLDVGGTQLSQGQTSALVDVTIQPPGDSAFRSASVGAGDGVTTVSYDEVFRAASMFTAGETWALGIGAVAVAGLAWWGLSRDSKVENPSRRKNRR